MNKQQYKEKLINHLIFRMKLKPSDKELLESLHELNYKDILLYYVDVLPVPGTLQECHNQFLWIRRIADHLLNKYSGVHKELRGFEKDYKTFIKGKKTETTADFLEHELKQYENYLQLIDSTEHIKKIYEVMILRFHDRLQYICLQYDKADLSLHSFCQLCGINYKTAKLNIRDEEIEARKHYHYIFDGIEDAREQEGWKSNRNGMPLFDLTSESFILLLDRNEEAKEKVDDYIMHEMGFAEHAVTIKEDSDGNMVVEKYYPKLKVMK